MQTVRKAVIPAAGLGTRFLPATKAQPKEMLPVFDKPAIQIIVEEAVASGIRHILVVTGRNKTSLENHFDRNLELENFLAEKEQTELLALVRSVSDMAQLFYVRQKEPLGLGHAVLCAKEFIGEEPFAIFLGDDLIHTDPPVKPAMRQLIDVWEKYQGPVLGVQKVPKEQYSSYGMIKRIALEKNVSKVLDMVEKPRTSEAPSDLAIVGRYVLTPDIFRILERTRPGSKGEIQLTDAMRVLNQQRAFYACQFAGRRYDVGSKLEFVEATVEYALRDPAVAPRLKKYLRGLKP
jgi:UTP--glucose-1-phosphate uridylyltransferase